MKKIAFMLFAASLFAFVSCDSPASEAEDVAEETEELNEEIQEYNEEVAEELDTTVIE